MKLLSGEKRRAYVMRKTIERFSLRVKMEYGASFDGASLGSGA